jgi:hypothetical protein
MQSHEYARNLQRAAEFLLSKPEFDIPNRPILWASYWSNKESFLAAVRALGNGKKQYKDSSLHFTVPIIGDVTFDLEISRSAVCRKVQEEKWECEPLLSDEEEAIVDANAK